MSRAFVKDDGADGPVLIPPRAPLPAGTPNYVTSRGLRLLREELVTLEAERTAIQARSKDDTDRTRLLTLNAGLTTLLRQRLQSARVARPSPESRDEVRFGATVTVRTTTGPREGLERRITIVGLDEADASEGLIAFVAPIARVLTGRKVADRAELRSARGVEELEIVAIEYLDVA